MTTPQTDLYALILRQVEREAEAVPQFNITSVQAREMLAHNIAGNTEMWMRAEVQELEMAARKAAKYFAQMQYIIPQAPMGLFSEREPVALCSQLDTALANAKEKGLIP